MKCIDGYGHGVADYYVNDKPACTYHLVEFLRRWPETKLKIVPIINRIHRG